MTCDARRLAGEDRQHRAKRIEPGVELEAARVRLLDGVGQRVVRRPRPFAGLAGEKCRPRRVRRRVHRVAGDPHVQQDARSIRSPTAWSSIVRSSARCESGDSPATDGQSRNPRSQIGVAHAARNSRGTGGGGLEYRGRRSTEHGGNASARAERERGKRRGTVRRLPDVTARRQTSTASSASSACLTMSPFLNRMPLQRLRATAASFAAGTRGPSRSASSLRAARSS